MMDGRQFRKLRMHRDKGENYQGSAAFRCTGEGRLRKVILGIQAEMDIGPENGQTISA